MGKITVFTKDRCKFCDTALTLLQDAVQSVLAEITAHPLPDAEFHGIEITVINVTRDYARAKQCKALSKQHTVPQIFFNSQHLGNCKQTQTFCSNGELRSKLRQLAYSASDAFPLRPEADIVKVTKDMAFSSQPALHQLPLLSSAGLSSLLSLVHSGESGFEPAERAEAEKAGLAYYHVPPGRAPMHPTGLVESDSLASWLSAQTRSVGSSSDAPSSVHFTASAASTAASSQEALPLAGGAAEAPHHPSRHHVGKSPCLRGLLSCGLRRLSRNRTGAASCTLPNLLHCLPEIAENPAEAADSGECKTPLAHSALPVGAVLISPPAASQTHVSEASTATIQHAMHHSHTGELVLPNYRKPQRRDSVTSSVASTVSDDLGLSDDDVRAFDAYDDDVGGRDPLDVIYTKSWAADVARVMEEAPKPMLVHCTTGVAACVAILCRAAKQRHAAPRQVYKWAKDLGYDIEAHGDLSAAVEFLLT